MGVYLQTDRAVVLRGAAHGLMQRHHAALFEGFHQRGVIFGRAPREINFRPAAGGDELLEADGFHAGNVAGGEWRERAGAFD